MRSLHKRGVCARQLSLGSSSWCASADTPTWCASADTPTRPDTATLPVQLQFGQSGVATKDLTRSFGWDYHDAFMQHDVQELARVLFEKMEERMKVRAGGRRRRPTSACRRGLDGWCLPTPGAASMPAGLGCGLDAAAAACGATHWLMRCSWSERVGVRGAQGLPAAQGSCLHCVRARALMGSPA